MAEDKSYCHSCSMTRHDADAIACKRTYCDARNVLARAAKGQGIRPPQLNPGELKPDADGWSLSLPLAGDIYDNWSAYGPVYRLVIDQSGNISVRADYDRGCAT
jgi:hypothetical protein